MNRTQSLGCFFSLFLSVFTILALVSSVQAAGTVCARVKIEIQQELTLERQAFDAHMRINNGLTNITLQDVNVTLRFIDAAGAAVEASSDPDSTSASFFHRVDSMTNISDVSGNGQVNPSTSADIHWLIIPAPGAAKGNAQGTVYYVGATLTYTIGGVQQTTEVTPDYIWVKPMPELTLDYFIPHYVYGDDAFTPEIEPVIPFPLGVLIKNNGTGIAKAVKIESAQPKIVDNEQGLDIQFIITGSEVNGLQATPSLLANFGDIKPNTSAIGRWIMTCSLSGQFTEFKARFSHSDELGGELTSLIQATNTHFLTHEVLVDLPGRDTIRDFLIENSSGDSNRVFESDTLDSPVQDWSSEAQLIASGSTYILSLPVTQGFVSVKLPDPLLGQQAIKSIVRSDGKLINPNNAWLSKARKGTPEWSYFFHIFDVNTPGIYTITFQDGTGPQGPTLNPIANRNVAEGGHLSFTVQGIGSMPPAVSVSGLPAGATFIDQGSGQGVFDWSPVVGQTGEYPLTFTATLDGQSVSQRMLVTVTTILDTDLDGLLDAWEMHYFGTLTRNGSGDFDGDGISDLDEFLLGLDPTQVNRPPSIPVIIAPANTSETSTMRPRLEIQPSTAPAGTTITYTYEIYTDKQIKTLLASIDTTSTTWDIPEDLQEDARYYWRVRATTNAKAFTKWAYASFSVNAVQTPPNSTTLSYPNNTDIDSRTPLFEFLNSVDPDGDVLSYIVEIYTSELMDTLFTTSPAIKQGQDYTTFWRLNQELTNNTRYYWKIKVLDEHGLITETDAGTFLVNTAASAPPQPTVFAPTAEITTQDTNLIINTPGASNTQYFFELDTAMTFDSPNRITSGPVQPDGDTAQWHVTSLADHTRYFWRVRALSGAALSPYAYAGFFVNTINVAPDAPTVRNPGQNAWMSTTTPLLEINAPIDINGDRLTYQFEVYSDEALTTLVAQIGTDTPKLVIPTSLTDKTWYSWRARAIDEHGAISPWTYTHRFFAHEDGAAHPSEITFLSPGYNCITNGQDLLIQWEEIDPSPNATFSLYYDTDASGFDGTPIVQGMPDDGVHDTYVWHTNNVPDGLYYIYAEVVSGSNILRRYCAAYIIVDTGLPSVSANPAPGLYQNTLDVTLTASEASDIYFTTDGSTPTNTSMIYSEPITIASTTTLMFRALDRAGNWSQMTAATYTIHKPIAVTVQSTGGIRITDATVQAYTEAGQFTGIQAQTDAQGIAAFNSEDFTAGAYSFRVSLSGNVYNSDSVAIPGVSALTISIPEAPASITVNTTAGPTAGVMVYVYSESSQYLNISALTDSTGKVIFQLPVGLRFKFRVDLQGTACYSDVTTITSGGSNTVTLNTVTAGMQVTVTNTVTPLSGIEVYLHSSTDVYLNQHGQTDGAGAVNFTVSPGVYKLRADYLGYAFWLPVTITGTTAVPFDIVHRTEEISLTGYFQGIPEPMEGMLVEICTTAGATIGMSQRTDASGKVSFFLPQAAYRARATYLGQVFWSDPFTSQNVTVSIPLGEANVQITGSGLQGQNVLVTVYSGDGGIAGPYGYTAGTGHIIFRLPAGSYRFRADYQGNSYWSATVTLPADVTTPVILSLGGGTFTLTVQKGPRQPMAGISCYVYNEAGDYLNISGATTSKGTVKFALAGMIYRFRVDYIGYQFWTDYFNVSTTLAGTLTIPHTNCTVSVLGSYQGTFPLANVALSLFTSGDVNTGQALTTNTSGKAVYNLPDRDFKVRADYLGQQFWSSVFRSQNVTMTINEGQALVTVTKSGVKASKLKVNLYSATQTTLNWQQTTNASGQVTYLLPPGSYYVQVEYSKSKVWSPLFTVTAGSSTLVNVNI